MKLLGLTHPTGYWTQRRHQKQTPDFLHDYASRAGVEGTISQAVGRFDLRRTRYFGLAKTHLQNIASACAINLNRFFAWSSHIPLSRTRTSSFSRLFVHCAEIVLQFSSPFCLPITCS